MTFLGTFGGTGNLSFAGQGTVNVKPPSTQVTVQSGVNLQVIGAGDRR